MKKFYLTKKYELLMEDKGLYYVPTLIDLLLEEPDKITLGWKLVEGTSNDILCYRIIRKKRR